MIEVKKRGPGTPNKKAIDKINKLKKGEHLILKKKEWLLATLPGAYILRSHLNREFKVQTLVDESGWKITALS